MIFRELDVAGTYLVSPEPITDERGAFARVFSAEDFSALGINPHVTQMSVATNPRRGTMRGMHLQIPPHAETKLVRCISGRAHDVLVDLRRDSATFLAWTAVALDAMTRDAVSIPEGVAHGYLTLEDETEMEYLISVPYQAEAAVGIRWDDPSVGVQWPFDPIVIGARDGAFPFLDRNRLEAEGLPALRSEGVQS